jgi:heme/copper-type cytochrome/quinol oxidase subunit 4
MLEIVLILAFLAATAWIAVHAFQNPNGTCRRSLIGFLLGVLAAVAVWWLATPMIANEAGLGAFVLFCIVVALCAFMAIVACIAASVRHVLNAFANRRRS